MRKLPTHVPEMRLARSSQVSKFCLPTALEAIQSPTSPMLRDLDGLRKKWPKQNKDRPIDTTWAQIGSWLLYTFSFGEAIGTV